MKTLAIATLGLVLAGTSISASAGSQDREHLTQCKNAVMRVFGEDTDVKLKGINVTATEQPPGSPQYWRVQPA